MKTFITILFTLHASLLTLHVSQAQIIHVPAVQPTIQAGINAANPGDTVLIADGTYLENINFLGKAITVASHFIMDADTNHINNTIIDGSQPVNHDYGSVVTFITGEDTTSVISGFTITGGTGMIEPVYGDRIGGGIACYIAYPKISHNKIIGNQVTSNQNAWGGGIDCYNYGNNNWIVIEHNVIGDNHCLSGSEYAVAGGLNLEWQCKNIQQYYRKQSMYQYNRKRLWRRAFLSII
jgi:hypothetical protein